MSFSCLVCAYPKLKEPPRSPSGGGSYEICPACGYQYGVDDDDKGITPAQWRKSWVQQGALWSSAGLKQPKDWQYVPEPKASSTAKAKSIKEPVAKRAASPPKRVRKKSPKKKS